MSFVGELVGVVAADAVDERTVVHTNVEEEGVAGLVTHANDLEAMVTVPGYDADPAALSVDGARAAVALSMMMRQ